MVRYFFYKLAQWIVFTFPLSFSFKLAQLLSDCQYFISVKDRNSVRKNIETLARDPENIKYLTKEVFRNFGRYLVEFLWMKEYFNYEFLQSHVEIVGKNNIEEAFARKNGVIIVTGHIGNWELGAAAFSLLGFPITAVALEHPHVKVNEFFNSQRNSLGVNVVSTQNAVRQCTKELLDNKAIAIVADRDFHYREHRMPFLAKDAQIPRGAAIFSVKYSAPIVPVFFTRKPGQMNFKFNIHEPIFPDQFQEVADREEKVDSIIKSYISIIEDEIRKDPSQWLMFREYDE